MGTRQPRAGQGVQQRGACPRPGAASKQSVLSTSDSGQTVARALGPCREVWARKSRPPLVSSC